MAPSLWPFRALFILSIFFALPKAQDSDGLSPYGTGFGSDVVAIDMSWNNSFPAYEGTTLPDLSDVDVNATDTLADFDDPNNVLSLSGRSAQGFFLRTMPLGASITEGTRSSDGNGYRKALRDQLRFKGWKVNMVGSKQNGNMADSDNEGHPGWVITEVHNAFSASAYMKPNLVLLNAGTNDCIQNIDTANAGTRIKVLIDDIFNSIPGVTVILSTILPGRDFDTCASSVSQQYRDLANTYINANARLQLADMHSFLTVGDLSDDGIHPLDPGYRKMAAVWWNAISKAESTMQAPAADSGVDDTAVASIRTCTKVAGNARGPIQSQQGSGHDDGLYVHQSTSMGNIPSGKVLFGPDTTVNAAIPSHMFFAQMVNSGGADRAGALDDWVRVEHKADGTNTYWLRENKGGATFADHVTFDVDMNCDAGPTYWFADFNNDGLDDFFCLGEGSAVSVSLNRGGSPPKFESIGQVVPAHAGYAATDVRIADIDGDGRADYCLIGSNGDILCSRNQGQGDSYSWQGFSTVGGLRGLVFPNKNKGDASGVRLADLNGDFRSDWMWIGDEGDVDTWINQRGWGTGIVPDWTHSGITHGGMSTPGVRQQIKFGRIYGSGRLDYVYFKNVTDGYEMHVWQNHGSGGTRRKGDGNFYCDMRNTGSDDYVWIYSDGHANSDEIYTNIHEPPAWGHETKITLSVPGPRSGIHLADWDGDGKCDVLVQDKKTGALTMWENRYDASTNTLKFVNVGVVTGAATCTQGWGVNIFDRGMAVVDIDGDGRADVLCIEPNGKTSAWLNPKAGLLNVGQIKVSEGWDRANIRFADVEASGRADLIHLDKYTGAASVIKNNGHSPGGKGSSFSWTSRGVLYSPIDRGETMNFANQGGLGRADLIHVLPVSNTAWTYFNECGKTSGGDDGPIADPGLPAYSGSGGSSGNPGPSSRSTFNSPTPTVATITSLDGSGAGQPTGVYTTVIPVSSCIPFADPDKGNDGSCLCSGYDETIPIKTGSNICDYTAYTATVTPTTAPPPYTTTSLNSQVVVYSSSGIYSGSTYGVGTPTTVLLGKILTTQQNPSASALVGSLTGAPLYTSVSSAIDEACGAFTSGQTITQCEEAKITGISYISEAKLHTDGTLVIGFPHVNIEDEDSMEAMIRSIAGMAQVNSQVPNATYSDFWIEDDTAGPRPEVIRHYLNFTLIPALIQVLYEEQTDDTQTRVVTQNLDVSFSLETEDKQKWGCPVSTMLADTAAGLGALLGLVALVPGFEWMAEVGPLIAGIGAGSAAVAEGLSLSCGIPELINPE